MFGTCSKEKVARRPFGALGVQSGAAPGDGDVVQVSLLEGERLCAFLDDIYVVCAIHCRGGVFVASEAFVGADRCTVHQGKTSSCRRFHSKSLRQAP